MYKLVSIIVGALALLLFSTCSTDFELNSDWKEVAVVWGLLDVSQDRQYIRLSRAYLSESSATEIASIPDSIYFENASVQLKAYSSTQYVGQGEQSIWINSRNRYELPTDANLRKTIDMIKVDASVTEDPDKDPNGLFATQPYQLYYTDEPLNPDHLYELVVTTDRGEIVRAVTVLISSLSSTNPRNNGEFNLSGNNSNRSEKIEWKSGTAQVFDVNIEFRYREELNNDPSVFTLDTFRYIVASGKTLDNNDIGKELGQEVRIETFLSSLANYIGIEGSENYKRFFRSLSMNFYSGSRTLKEYIEVSAVDSGISNGQAKPIFTNIENGIGLFGSTYKESINANLDGSSLKVLVCSEQTKDLRFFSNDVTGCD